MHAETVTVRCPGISNHALYMEWLKVVEDDVGIVGQVYLYMSYHRHGYA